MFRFFVWDGFNRHLVKTVYGCIRTCHKDWGVGCNNKLGMSGHRILMDQFKQFQLGGRGKRRFGFIQ